MSRLIFSSKGIRELQVHEIQIHLFYDIAPVYRVNRKFIILFFRYFFTKNPNREEYTCYFNRMDGHELSVNVS